MKLTMKHYIGSTPIKAKPMTRLKFVEYYKGDRHRANVTADQEGYLVEYPDGYLTWVPEGAFNSAYIELTD